MNLLSKLWNKIVDTYYNIYEWFYITFNKTTYWKYDLTNGTAYCSVSEGVLYISLEDYRLMESDEIGRVVLKDFIDKSTLKLFMNLLNEELDNTLDLMLTILEDLSKYGQEELELYQVAKRSVEIHFEHFENKMNDNIKKIFE